MYSKIRFRNVPRLRFCGFAIRKDPSWRREGAPMAFMGDIETMKTSFATKRRLFWV